MIKVCKENLKPSAPNFCVSMNAHTIWSRAIRYGVIIYTGRDQLHSSLPSTHKPPTPRYAHTVRPTATKFSIATHYRWTCIHNSRRVEHASVQLYRTTKLFKVNKQGERLTLTCSTTLHDPRGRPLGQTFLWPYHTCWHLTQMYADTQSVCGS